VGLPDGTGGVDKARPVEKWSFRVPLPRSKNVLRVAVAVGGIVPVAAGLAGMFFGPRMIDGQVVVTDVDSHFRYLSGLLLAIGLGFWSTIPEIERTTNRFRLLTVLVIFGGLGRLIGLWLGGVPGLPMLLALGMELVVTPGLCFWQSTVAREGMDWRD